MSHSGSSPNPIQKQNLINSVVIKIAVQVGCLTLLIILAALILGLWLDNIMSTRPLFTILFMVGSMPMTWVAIFRVVNRSKQQIIGQPGIGSQSKGKLEEEDRDKD